METIVFILIAFIAIAAYLKHLFSQSDKKPATTSIAAESESADPLLEARRVLKAAMDKCQNDHEAAYQALLWLAGSDGTISKQEARNVLRFCERQATELPAGTYDALEYLNNGMQISTGRTSKEALADLATLADKPIAYRTAFIGAAHAICGGNKRISKAKQDFLDRASSLMDSPQ